MNVAPEAVTRDLRRRLGQYFTGTQLARLLAALAGADGVRSVIDPMAGSGDMLAAVIESGAPLARVGAIEIEPIAFDTCRQRLALAAPARTEILSAQGNAFDLSTWTRLAQAPWDLVITNPPYVRYQRTATAASGDLEVPSATAVRRGLEDVIAHLGHLDSDFRLALRDLVSGYSGLADLAVPSWILCAALVKPGGTLAMLVPDTWLSREYAAPLSALLDRFFDIQYVVHDADAVWFSEASVRTTLFVARRHSAGSSPTQGATGPLHVRLDHRAASETSLVGRAFLDSASPEAAFAEAAQTWRSTGAGPTTAGCRFEPYHPQAPASAESPSSAGREVPIQLRPIVAASPRMLTLEDLGWRVGQGLRTGANLFFYGSAEYGPDGHEQFRADRKVGGGLLPTAPGLMLPVVRSQFDLPAGTAIERGEVSGRVLALQRHVRPEDRRGSSPEEDLALAQYELLSPKLADHITFVEALDLGTNGNSRFVPDLSAVRPNIRKFDTARPTVAPRFWYQLPEFAPRHRPDLFIARVNYRHPRAVLNPDRSVLIDANFSTLWQEDQAGLGPLAMLALLSSTWAQASMELLGTVLGGGALKLEAAQLRRLLVPTAVRDAEDLLTHTGSMLREAVDTADTRAAIDDVLSPLLGLDPSGAHAVAEIADRQLKGRTR